MVALVDEIVRFLLVTDGVLSLSEMVSATAVVRSIPSTVVVAFRPLNDAYKVELGPSENSVTFWIGTTVIIITCVNALEEVRSLARTDESLDRTVESLAATVVECGRSLSGTLVILDSAMVRSLAEVAVELAELVV